MPEGEQREKEEKFDNSECKIYIAGTVNFSIN